MHYTGSFVTNSSSSSFIVTNKSDKVLTNRDVAKLMEFYFNRFKYDGWCNKETTFEEFIESSDSVSFTLEPGETTYIECGDHGEDGLFENVVHFEDDVYHDEFSIEYHRSNH